MMVRFGSALLLMCASALVAALELPAELAWAERATLSLSVSGVVEEVRVRPGAAVAADDVLMSLDTRSVRAQLVQADSAMQRFDLQRAEAEREWERAQELFDRTVLSERELQLAEIGLAQANADYQAAKTLQVEASVNLERHTLKAPFAARVLSVSVAAGQALVNAQQATPLLSLVASDRMRARALLDVEQANALRSDAAVAVRVADQRFEAEIMQIGFEPVAEQRPAQYVLEVEFAVPAELNLRVGQAAVLELP